MSSQTFSFLTGSLALENHSFHMPIAEVINKIFADCDGYVGYKLTTLGRASDDDVPSFLIVTRQHGIILIDVVEERIDKAEDSDGGEYWITDSKNQLPARSLIVEIYEEEVQSRLKNDFTLYDRKTRRVKTPIRSAVVFCENDQTSVNTWYNTLSDYSSIPLNFKTLGDWLTELPKDYNCSSQELDRIYSLLEGTFIYENKSLPSAEVKLITVNDYIQKSLKTTFKQDEAQRLASMQLPPGPQRIRGLAGTGKTIVLSLKAAITHKKFPEFKILYLFNTQSLYQHVQNLISKYYTLEAKRTPDFENHLQVFHAWGGKQRPGLYSSLCKQYGLIPLTLGDVRGRGDSLAFIYKDLLTRIGSAIKPEYDLILIDEAQDFSNEIFEVIYKLAKGEGASKRIIWAYDEFQSLRDTEIKGPKDLFGRNELGEPNLPDSVLDGKYPGEIPKDFVLPNCYRTPRPVLMIAHGVALGLYTTRPNEMFYHHSEWEAIGYKVNEPTTISIFPNDDVEIERTDESSKNLLESVLRENKKLPLHLIQCEKCTNNESQLAFIAEKIQSLISTQNVAAEEIIIVNLKSGNNKDAMLEIQRTLTTVGVRSVIPGYVESADIFKPKGFVTITTPFRAKGNEANIVFVINAQQVSSDFSLRMRNAFFVGVTRSRGWCYITGFGQGIENLSAEIEGIKADFPKFRFKCPDPATVQSTKTFLNKTEHELNKIQEMLEFVEKNPEIKKLMQDRLK
jgi:superfamily I DNA and RNA helicase